MKFSLPSIFIISTLVILSGYSGHSQNNSLGVNIKVYSPHGEFNRNVTHTPFGLSFLYKRQSNESPFSWGSEFGIAMYYNNKYDYELIREGYPGEFVEVDEEDCFWTLHIIGQYDFMSTPAFKSYGEVRLGMTTFFSSRTTEEENTHFKAQFKFHGTAFNTGFGAGMMINPGRLFSKDKEPGNLWINLGANVHTGSSAAYRSVSDSNATQTLGEGKYRSLTYYTDFRLGVLFKI